MNRGSRRGPRRSSVNRCQSFTWASRRTASTWARALHLDPAPLAVLAGLDPVAGLGPGAPDVEAAARPVDVLLLERRRLPPARAARERDGEEGDPAGVVRPADLEESLRLLAAKPLEVLLARGLRDLADEEGELGGRVRPGPAMRVHLPLLELRERPADPLDHRARLPRASGGQDRGRHVFGCNPVPGDRAELGVGPPLEPAPVDAGARGAEVAERHLLGEERGERLAERRVGLGALGTGLGGGRAQVHAGEARAVEVAHEVDRVLLGVDDAREPLGVGGADQDPELRAVGDVGGGDRRGALHFAALSCCRSPRSTNAWTVVSRVTAASFTRFNSLGSRRTVTFTFPSVYSPNAMRRTSQAERIRHASVPPRFFVGDHHTALQSGCSRPAGAKAVWARRVSVVVESEAGGHEVADCLQEDQPADRAGVRESDLLRHGLTHRRGPCQYSGAIANEKDRAHRILSSAWRGAAGAARPTFANGLRVLGTWAGWSPRSRSTRARTDFPRWRY